MAWKEFSEMKPTDQMYEKKKQAMIVAQNALSHATQIVMGLGASGLDEFTLTNVTKRIKETAESLTLWVYGQAEVLTAAEAPKPTKKPVKKEAKPASPPAPQLEEKKVLDAVAEILGVIEDDKLRVRVRDWVHAQVGKYAYPKKMASVDKIVEDLKG